MSSLYMRYCVTYRVRAHTTNHTALNPLNFEKKNACEGGKSLENTSRLNLLLCQRKITPSDKSNH